VLFNDIPDLSLSETPNHDQYILVVGGLGYIGSHTSLELVKAGHNIIIVDNLSNSYRTVLDKLHQLKDEHFNLQHGRLPHPSIQFHEVDYRDQATMNLILSKYTIHEHIESHNDRWSNEFEFSPRSMISSVIHFAAYKSVAESIKQSLRYYSNNVGGLIDFCTLLGDFNIKIFIFSSSATVYGEQATHTGRISEDYCTHETTVFTDSNGEEQITQSGCTDLTNPYGRTKWMCEAILNDLATSDPEWSIFALRYFNPIGCDSSGMLGEDPRSTPNNLMPVVVKVMTGDLPVLNIYGTDWDTEDGTAVRDFIHVSDLARGHLAAYTAASKSDSRKDGTGFRVFNLGTGKGSSVLKVVEAMQKVSGKQLVVGPRGRRNGDVAVCVADPTRAEVELGWKTEKMLEDCCVDICNFLGVKSDA